MTTNSDLLKKFGNQIANLKGWEVMPLENVLKLITYGLTVRPKYHPQGIPLVSATQIRNGVVDLDSAPRISVDDYEKLSDKCKARPGDILFAKTGAIGHCAICHSEEKVALAQNVARLVFDETLIEAKFALRYLRTPFIQDLAKRSAKGNAVQDLQLGEIRKFPIPIPPLEEQRRIAAILDKADAVRRKRKEAIALTEELLRSAFLEMFGDPVTNPKGWEAKPLGSVCNRVTVGYVGSMTSEYIEEGIPWLRSMNVSRNRIILKDLKYVSTDFHKRLNKSSLSPGDVVAVRRPTPRVRSPTLPG